MAPAAGKHGRVSNGNTRPSASDCDEGFEATVDHDSVDALQQNHTLQVSVVEWLSSQELFVAAFVLAG